MTPLKRYLVNVAAWLDEGVNVLFLAGNAHETISERAAVARQAGKRWGCAVCKGLGWVIPGHCDRTWAEMNTPQIVNDRGTP